ncbi:MAG: hypothetical protein U0411_14610 [Thermodesulfovibrionales bacterium]
MKSPYVPPQQSTLGQIADSLILLVLIYVVLLTPILLGLTAAGKTEAKKLEKITWETLEQNPTMAAQWEKLGYTPEKAAAIINQKFDYRIKLVPFLITSAVLIGYFVMVLKMSDKEYREVIAEKFD